jgi:hypothetical protein
MTDQQNVRRTAQYGKAQKIRYSGSGGIAKAGAYMGYAELSRIRHNALDRTFFCDANNL